MFDAIVQMRVEDITNNYRLIDSGLQEKLVNLRKNITAENANIIIQDEEFHVLSKNITATSGSQSQMTVLLLKDISLFLSFIVAAREADIDLHLQCERQFIKLVQQSSRFHCIQRGTRLS